MAGDHLIFDAYNIERIVPDHYDPNIYSYRYRNGVRAESISGFADIRRRLEHLLRDRPYTTEQLSRELPFDRHFLQKILDYLFTHTGEVAALDIPEQNTLYIWADVEAAEGIRAKLVLGSVDIHTDDYSAEDITGITSYLTNLLVLNPSVELLDNAIDKCRLLLDAARLAQAFQPSADVENRIVLLKKKHDQLVERREREVERWTHDDDDDEEVDPYPPEPGMDVLPDVPSFANRYAFGTLYLLGSRYAYSGPEPHKHMCIDHPELTTMDFTDLKSLVIEMDTFTKDLDEGRSILGSIEPCLGSVFPGTGMQILFRKLPGMKYKRATEKLMHQEALLIRQRGYRISGY